MLNLGVMVWMVAASVSANAQDRSLSDAMAAEMRKPCIESGGQWLRTNEWCMSLYKKDTKTYEKKCVSGDSIQVEKCMCPDGISRFRCDEAPGAENE